MIFRYLSSFDKSFSKLDNNAKEKVASAIEKFLSFCETGLRPEGLGLKKLRKMFWEIRVDIKTRIIVHLHKNMATFVLAGNHDQIKKFLRNR